jgi:hypothetical protein
VAAAIFGMVDAIGNVRKSWRRAALVLVAGAAVVLVASELQTTVAYHRTLAATGGNGIYSDAIYQLADDLDRPGGPPVVAMDWGFARNLQLLTAGRVEPVQAFTYGEPGDEAAALLEARMQAGPALFLFHGPKATNYHGYWDLFQDLADRHRLEPVLQKVYLQRNGQPVYLTYSLRPAGHVTEMPAEATRSGAEVGNGLGLLGYTLPSTDVHPGGHPELTLYWTARERQAHPAKVFVHLFDSSGKLVAQHDAVPANWGYPTTDWQPGEVVRDRVRLALPGDIAPGTYHIFVGMYDEATGERLPLSVQGQRLSGDTLGLADMTVSP